MSQSLSMSSVTIIDNEIGGAGPINIQDLWYAFNHPQDKDGQDIANHWKKEMERINSYC